MSEPTNEERAARIDEAMTAYIGARDHSGRMPDYDEDDVRDLLADLMHWCKREEIDFEENLRIARDNFEAEIIEE